MLSVSRANAMRLARWIATAVSMSVFAGLLAACASAPNIKADNVAGLPERAPSQPISLARIIGVPPNVSKQLTAKLKTAAGDKNVTVVPSKDKTSQYTLRGYIATSPDATNHKLSYIWDVTDKSGKRVHRITGEETVRAKPGGNPWSSIGDQTLTRIASSTMGNLATWLPTQSTAATPVAARPTPKPTPAAARPAPSRKARTSSRDFLARVPSIRGAPGDGKSSLASALRDQFRKKGIKLAQGTGRKVFTVAGRVTMSDASSSKQSISIKWQITGPSGENVGVVSQNNKIPKGSLDGRWGPVASLAAAGAIDQILDLIKQH